MRYSARILDAAALAYECHGEQRRKNSEVPYIVHPFAVAALVGEYGGTEDQFIAALLHDTVEDGGGLPVLERIRARFGDPVAEWVWACSDSHTQPKPPWRARKEKHLAAMADAAPELKLILAADKLHNARAIALSHRSEGATVWERFNGGREGTRWYYREAVAALNSGWNHPLLCDLAAAVEVLLTLD